MTVKAQRKKLKSKIPASGMSSFSPGYKEYKERMLTRIKELAEPMCEAGGMELVHVEYQRETGGRILRIYIDKPGGVLLDDCVHISRQLSDLLDVYVEDNDSYRLEVSSPGSDRPLGKKLDFERFKGSDVKIKTAQPVDGQRNFSGLLLGLSGGVVNIMIDDKTVAVPFQEIMRARLVNHDGES